MLNAKKINNAAASLLLASLLSLSFIYALTASLNFKFSPFKLLGVSFVMLAAYTVTFWSKLTRRLVLGLFSLVIIVFSIYLIKKGLFLNYVYHISDIAYWFGDYITGNVVMNLKYGIYVTLFICFLISLAVFFLTVKYFSFPIVLLGGVALFATQWILEYFVSFGAFYLFVFTILLCYFRHVYFKKYVRESGDFVNPLQFLFWAMPVCGLVFTASVFIPASPKPVEWKWLDEKIISVTNYFNTEYSNSFSKFDYFSIEYTGFGNSGKLGGKVKLDNTIVMEVEAGKPGYLRASGKDTYTGSAWLDTDKDLVSLKDMNNKLIYDFLELQVGFPLLAGGGLSNTDDYLTIAEHSIRFKSLKTKSLFIPYLSQEINFEAGSDVGSSVNGNSTIIMDKTAGKDFSYKTESLSIDFINDNFKNVIRRSKKGFYSDIQKYRMYSEAYRYNNRTNSVLIRSENGGTIRYTDFINRLALNAEKIYAKYTQIPEITPKRVKDLAFEITGNFDNNYDKVKAIEQYLSSNFQYTLSPRSTPKGRDFTDYFLFDLKQGYCTYYASAMAILVRSIGLPARYVEGYMMPSTPSSENMYTVTNENAHAWVEVYFEGFGWLPFEPTAPFTVGFYMDRSLSPIEGGDVGSEALLDEGMNPEPSPEEEVFMPEGTAMNSEQKLPVGIIILIAAGALVAVVSLIIGINIVVRKRKILEISKMNPRNSTLSFYKHFVYIMKLQGYDIRDDETPTQYSGRIDKRLFLSPVNFESVTEVFMLARYSRNDMEDSVKDLYSRFYDILIENCKYNMGKYKFFFYRYILGRV